MINEKKFNEVLKQYNEEMNIKRRSEGWMDLSEMKLRKKLTEEIFAKRNGINTILEAVTIKELLDDSDYRGLHNLLQEVFQEFIPFVTIRRFLSKSDRYGLNLVCTQVNNLKKQYQTYSETMCHVRYNSLLLEYLCNSEEEIRAYDDIYAKYNNDWDRMTEYRKSRIERGISQLNADYIKNIIQEKSTDLKDYLQHMFGDFIEDIYVKKFLDKISDKGLNIANSMVNLHKKYELEKFHCLLLIV